MVAVVEVDGAKITLTSVLNDGRIVDKCVIDKDKDEILPYSVAPVYLQTRLMFKGMDTGLCTARTPPVLKDGVWYAPMATLTAFCGGYVLKEKGCVTCEFMRHRATFFENSDIALADGKDFKLNAAVFRGIENQLYMPIEGFCNIFNIKWAYAKRNNFISVEYCEQDFPISEQP